MTGDAENEEQSPGVLHLGQVGVGDSAESPAGPGGPPTMRPRRRWAVALTVFLVGVLVGSYAWLTRADMLDANRVDLIVTEISHEPPQADGTLTRVVAYVRNIGDKDVTIVRARLPDQRARNGTADVAVAPGESSAVALHGELSCARSLPDAIEADIRTPDGETSTRIPMPRSNFRYRGFCGSDSPDAVWLANPRSSTEPDRGLEQSGDRLSMTIPFSINSWGVSEVEIVDVSVSSGPGIDSDASGLIGPHETGTVADLSVEWTIADCSTAVQVLPIEVTVTFAEHPPDMVRVPEFYMRSLVSQVFSECGP